MTIIIEFCNIGHPNFDDMSFQGINFGNVSQELVYDSLALFFVYYLVRYFQYGRKEMSQFWDRGIVSFIIRNPDEIKLVISKQFKRENPDWTAFELDVNSESEKWLQLNYESFGYNVRARHPEHGGRDGHDFPI